MNDKLIRIFFLILIVAGTIFHFIGAVIPPENNIYSIDERILTESSALLLLNNPPICLEWPASTLIIPIFILFCLKFLFYAPLYDSLSKPGIESISNALNGHLYNAIESEELIIAGRVFIAIVFLISIFLIFRLLHTETFFFRWFFIFLYSVSGTFITQSWVLHPDSIAIIFWTLLLLYLLKQEHFSDLKVLVLTSFLFSLCVTSKFIYVAFFPIVLLAIILRNNGYRSIKTGIKSGSVFLVTFLVFTFFLCPFILTNPLTLLKGFFGNLLVKSAGQGNSIAFFINVCFHSVFGMAGSLLAILGTIVSFYRIEKWKAWLLLGTFLIFLLPVVNASISYERYVMPLLPIAFLWACYGLEFLSLRIKMKPVQISVVIIISIFISAECFAKSCIAYSRTHSASNMTACIKWINEKLPEHSIVALPEEFEGMLKEDLPSIENNYIRNNSFFSVERKLNKMAGEKVKNQHISNVVLDNIFFEEKGFYNLKCLIKKKYLSENDSEKKAFCISYFSSYYESKLYSYSFEEIIAEPEVQYLISSIELNSIQFYLAKSFTELNGMKYYAYKCRQ